MNLKIKKIADYYGFARQSRQLSEECAEIIQAVNKYHRCNEKIRGGDNIMLSVSDSNMLIQNIVEEIADVEIMLEQIKYLLNINNDAVNKIKDNKLDRQIARIKKEREM